MQNRRIQLEDLLNRAQAQQETVWQTRNFISILSLSFFVKLNENIGSIYVHI